MRQVYMKAVPEIMTKKQKIKRNLHQSPWTEVPGQCYHWRRDMDIPAGPRHRKQSLLRAKARLPGRSRPNYDAPTWGEKKLMLFLTLNAFRTTTIFQRGKRTNQLLVRRAGAFERGNPAIIKDRAVVPHVASSPRECSSFGVTSPATSGRQARHSDRPTVPRLLRLVSATKNQEVSLKKPILKECCTKEYKTEQLNSNTKQE